MYQKEIIYMSLFDNQIKEGCVGFLKSENKQGKIQLELQVKNLSRVSHGSFAIRLQNETGWQEEGPLVVSEGNGRWTGGVAKPVLRAEIFLSESLRIKGESKNVHTVQERTVNDTDRDEKAEAKTESADERKENIVEAEKTIEVKENMAETEKVAVEKENTVETEKRLTEQNEAPAPKQEELLPFRQEPILFSQERVPAVRPAGRGKKVIKSETTPLYENKWEQLLSTYERIHPYGDNRVYVKLAPKDFVVLRENYQHLVNNSFLLHGFYNYRYLILGKEKDFYLGVPGVFYEREKMVALMFGFEAFECEGGIAEEGKFGYYLRRVEI